MIFLLFYFHFILTIRIPVNRVAITSFCLNRFLGYYLASSNAHDSSILILRISVELYLIYGILSIDLLYDAGKLPKTVNSS